VVGSMISRRLGFKMWRERFSLLGCFVSCSLFEQSNAELAHILSWLFLGKKTFFLIELKCAAIKWFHLWTKPEFCFGIGSSTIIKLKCQKMGFLLQSKIYHRTMNFATRIIQICCGIMNCYIHNANILWNKELRLLEQYKI